MADDPHVLAPGMAPTPFLAEEIRGVCSAGRTLRALVEAAGSPPSFRVSRYVACDADGATLERSLVSLDGTLLADPEVDHVTWLELQGHASFSAADTTIEPERIDTALGTLDCLRYTVRRGDVDEVFWFATDLPGMPVRRATLRAGQVLVTVTVVEITEP